MDWTGLEPGEGAMRARNIKPGFFDNDRLAECAAEARLLFIGLWCCADREGRIEDRPARIAARVFPFDRDLDIEDLMSQLIERGFIVRYEAQGVKCIEVVGFLEHQHPHKKEGESRLPPRPGRNRVKTGPKPGIDPVSTGPKPGHDRTQTGASPVDSLNGDSLNPDTGIMDTAGPACGFDLFWAAYPAGRKHAKAKARAAWERAITKADPAEIIAAATEYAASDVGRSEFVKGPEPWLNGECWADDRAAWQRRESKSTAAPSRMANLEDF